MENAKMPPKLFGEWIWRTDSLDKIESYVFFRKKFSSTETPSLAELWITAQHELPPLYQWPSFLPRPFSSYICR